MNVPHFVFVVSHLSVVVLVRAFGTVIPMHHPRVVKSSFGATPADDDDDSDEKMLPPEAEEFFATLEEWLEQNVIENKDDQYEPKSYTLEDLEEYVNERGNSTPTELVSDEPIDDDDEEAPWIDPESYPYFGLDQDDDGDGRFEMDPEHQKAFQTFIEQQAPFSIDPYESSDTPEDMWNEIRQNGQNISSHYDPAVAEELHRQVFELEEGFKDNSDIFRDALIDPSQADAAAALRRGQSFRASQEETIKSLQKELKDFQLEMDAAPCCARCFRNMLGTAVRSPDETLCKSCYELVEKETQKISELKSQLSPWIGIIDPDTKEVFYWNEETEEMRWDRPEDVVMD